MDDATYVEGLRHELAAAIRAGDRRAARDLRTELNRITGRPVENADRK